MFYSLLFRSKWAALIWAAWIIIGVYVRMEVFGTGMFTQAQPPEQAKPVNPWAKTAQ